MVLLHGFPASSFIFRELIPLLAGRYHVIAPDHLGFGLSDAPPTGRGLAGMIVGSYRASWRTCSREMPRRRGRRWNIIFVPCTTCGASARAGCTKHPRDVKRQLRPAAVH